MNTDAPAPTRPGEDLDRARLEPYLQASLGLSGELEVEQFPRGFSNLTYLIRLGHTEMVLRRPPFGATVKTAHDMGREYRILSALKPVYPKVPRPLLYCQDETILGAPFYVMERLHGVILRNKPSQELTPERMRGLSEALLDALVELHQFDYRAAGLSDLGRPEGYVERQVSGWAKRYEAARTDEVSGMERAVRWLAEHQPRSYGAALIHNDFKYDNLMLEPHQPTRVVAVLDWEMATLGDPLMDLGTTLGYWAQADSPPGLRGFGLTHLPGNLTRAGLAQRYAEKTGADLSHIVFYYVFGLFKVGVIMQQIYARFKAGKTQDARFGALIGLIHETGGMLEAAMGSKSL